MLCEQTEEFEASEMASFFTVVSRQLSAREKKADGSTNNQSR